MELFRGDDNIAEETKTTEQGQSPEAAASAPVEGGAQSELTDGLNGTAPTEVDQTVDGEIDSILEEEDPGFVNSLKELKESSELAKAQVDFDEDHKPDLKGIKKFLYKSSAGIWLVLFVKSIPRRIRAFGNWILDSLWYSGKYLFVGGPKDLLRFIKFIFGTLFGLIGGGLRKFSNLKGPKKLAFLATLVLTGVLVALVKHSGTISHMLNTDQGLFLRSFEQVADKKYEYDPDLRAESFYNSLRFSGNIFRIRRVVVNLKASTGHPQPMALFQVIVEGNSQDVIVEIKSRESEMTDAIQRATEEFTFDVLQSADGKKDLMLRLKQSLNERLTTGQVRRVYLQTIVLKP